MLLTRVVHCMIEPYDIYIGRGRCPKSGQFHGTILQNKPGNFFYGNPWSHKKSAVAQFQTANAEESVLKFRQYIDSRPQLIEQIRQELRGKTLGCWCKTKKNPHAPCHGDILAAIANS